MKKQMYFLLILGLISCAKQKNNPFQSKFEKKGDVNQMIQSIKIDTVKLEKINCSFSGITKLVDDKIVFVDERFCWVFLFDKEGNLIEKKLGKGRSNIEVNTGFIDEYIPLDNGDHLLIGSGMDCHVYNSNWELINKYQMNLIRSNKDLNQNDIYNDKTKYTLQWEKLHGRSNDQYAFLPIYVDSNQQNPYMLTKEYYTDMKVLAKMNLETGDVEEMIGSFSPIYLENRYIPQQAFLSFDINSKNELLVSYHADSLIYITDDSFHIKKAFGRAGHGVSSNYQKLKSLKQFLPAFRKAFCDDTYYRQIEFIAERNLLFRSYSKANKSKFDGLQIYRNDTLIADVNVPKNLDIIGYSEPYFYSKIIIDEENEKMKLYRFEI